MWHLCGVIIEIQLSDPQLSFESILEIHFLFIYEIPIYGITFGQSFAFWMLWSRPRSSLSASSLRSQSPEFKITMLNPMYGKLEEKKFNKKWHKFDISAFERFEINRFG